MFTFGLVNNPTITVTVSPVEEEIIAAQTIIANNPDKRSFNEALKGVVFNNFRRRMREQGAEETRWFPVQ